ncbi:hypothetical protein GCM10010168_51340 [Actinoplanes ianthinogenes]|uniref:DOD-type homing endonuclease domain-containing protein n=1 Tax=Actinoplanes ianthinogenes TaxID=122358 RepID=A0ABN6CM92_9ACTN|nr:LAGLIDADG family homing endonuclease [Actinoplanes ianthinogenes]BCJ46185.1 hypothetical protein Aiant_68420 [Actinoplanes ianthinogenes]GGR26887.1 hypothetical protein GCM10010168_51340 [Actinoplanes ianthinogenes]
MAWPFSGRRKPARTPKTGWVPGPLTPPAAGGTDRHGAKVTGSPPAAEGTGRSGTKPAGPPPATKAKKAKEAKEARAQAAPRPAGAVRRNRWLDGQGFYEPRVRGIKSTTRQAEALNIAVAAPPTSPRGLIIGQDAETGQSVTHDPFEAYFDGVITSPNVIVIGDVGKGKALDVGTPVATPGGWSTMGELTPGDHVFDEHGRPTPVIAVSAVMHDRPCYEVVFSDGSSVIADADHLWVTETLADRTRAAKERHRPPQRVRRGTTEQPAAVAVLEARPEGHRRAGGAERRPVTTRQIAATLRSGGRLNHAVATAGPLQMPEGNLPVPPYVLGASLAGGLRELGVFGDKHIPVAYLRAGLTQRRALLAGLLDTDGTISPGGRARITLTHPRLARDVWELALSLGFPATMRERRAKLAGRDRGAKWMVTFTAGAEVLRPNHKKHHLRARTGYRYITEVRPVPSIPVRCIQVAAESGMFLAGRELIPTHNSSLLKTWAVLRQLLLGRRVVVIDKKLDGKTKEGEYAPTARQFGVEPIKFTLDGTGSRINVLDPAISAREAVGEASPAGQSMLLRAVLAEALERPLTPKEGKALRVAHRTALRRAGEQGRAAVIGDIVAALLQPDADAAREARVDVARLLEWGYDAAFELERMIEEDLAGLVDAPTSANVNLDAGLTVFDVSALPETGPALPIVMSIINTWLMNVLANQDEPVQTIFVVEEGWHLIEGSFAKVARRNWKLARGLGLCNVVAVHHISDVPADSPAIAMVKEAETVFIYGQAKEDDARECVRLFNLPSTAMGILLELPKGTPLVKIGSADPIIVSHLRSDLEVELTNTDAAMTGTGVIVRDEEADLSGVEVGA